MDYKEKYDKLVNAIKVLQETNPSDEGIQNWVNDNVPELRESEDEMIRKRIIQAIKIREKEMNEEWSNEIAWIEKQGSQDNAEDVDILHRFSFYSYKDDPNVLYLSGLYVNEEYRNKGIGTKILEVADEVVKSLNCHTIRLKTKKYSDAERLYRTHGYNSLATEERDWIWLEKQGDPHIACSEEQIDELENEYLKSIPKY